jgi:hypothetical protein
MTELSDEGLLRDKMRESVLAGKCVQVSYVYLDGLLEGFAAIVLTY